MMPDSSNHRTIRSKSIKKYFRLPFWNISFQDFIGCTCTRCKALFNLTLSQTTHFRLFQTETICRRQF